MSDTADIRILVLDDEPDDAFLLTRHLRKAGISGEVRALTRLDELEPALAEAWDILLTDFRLAGATALDALAVAGRAQPGLPVIVVSGVIDEEDAGAAFRAGARDFISKQRLERLAPAMWREIEAASQARAAADLETQVQRSAAQLDVMLGRIPGAVWVLDDQLRVVGSVGGLLLSLGIDLTSMVGRSILELPLLSGEGLAAHRRALEGIPVSYENAAAGHIVAVRVEPLQAADGTITGVVGFGHEVTEERARERRRSELETVVDALLDGVLLLDADGRVRAANEGAGRLFGHAPADLTGKSVEEIFDAEAAATLAGAIGRVLQNERVIGLGVTTVPDRGSRLDLELTLAPVAEGSTVVDAVAVVARDVSERRRLESELAQALKMEAVGQLAAGVAHDLNNILLAVRGFTSLLRDDLEGTPAIADLAEIEDAAGRGAALVSRLLAFGKRRVLHPVIVDLGEAVERLGPLLRTAAGALVTLELAVDEKGLRVEIDPSQLDQMLVNLVVNARDAMPAGGRISVRLRCAKGADGVRQAVLAVEDDGAGMPPETVERIFDPFFTTKRERGGTGLGLSIVHGAVAQSGGTITVESTVGVGTTFTITLPLTAETSTAPAPAGDAEIVHSGHVLVVDDDEIARSLVVRLVERLGYTVTAASGGDAALASLAVSVQPDVVVSDLVMPGMDGGTLLARIAARLPDAGLIAMSGFPDAAADGLPESCVFLAKPFGREELSRALHNARTGRAPTAA